MKKRDSFIKGFNDILYYTDLGSLIIICIALNAIFELYKICTKDMEIEGTLALFDAFGTGFSVFLLMTIFVIPMSISMMHNLLIMSPVKSDHIPKSMMLMIDIIFIGSFITELPQFLLGGLYKELFMEFIGLTLMYITVCFGSVSFTQPGMTVVKWDFKIRYIFLWIGIVVFGIFSCVVRFVLTFEKSGVFSFNVILITGGILFSATVIIRIFCAKRLYAKLRMTKVFKNTEKKERKPKEESYI